MGLPCLSYVPLVGSGRYIDVLVPSWDNVQLQYVVSCWRPCCGGAATYEDTIQGDRAHSPNEGNNRATVGLPNAAMSTSLVTTGHSFSF